MSHDSNMVRIEAATLSSLRALILAERKRLNMLWDQLKAGETVRNAFWPARKETYTEAMLDLHVDEVQRCEAEREECLHLLSLVDSREAAIKEIDELRVFCADAARLMDRKLNSSSVRRREERLRELTQREIPAIEEQLALEIER